MLYRPQYLYMRVAENIQNLKHHREYSHKYGVSLRNTASKLIATNCSQSIYSIKIST